MRRAVFIACWLLAPSAFAAGKKVAVIEAKSKGVAVQGLERGLRAALKVNHGYVAIGADDLKKTARSMGIQSTADMGSDQLMAVAKKAGVDLLVLVRAKNEGKGLSVDMRVDATDSRGSIWSANYPLKKAKLDRVSATDMARDVRAADASGVAKKPIPAEGLQFSLDEAPAPAAAAPKSTAAQDEDENAPNVSASSAEEQRKEVAAEDQEDDEFIEPTEVDENAPKVRYIPADGRPGFVATAGLDILMRRTLMSASNGLPPRYDGVFSPGLSLHAELFPRRFKEGGTLYREFGGYVNFAYAFMPSSYIQGGTAKNFTDQYMMIEAGAAWQRVFGKQDKSPSFGVRVGFHYDQLRLANNFSLPFHATSYGAPYLGIDGEVPVMGKKLMAIGQLGIMPVAAVGSSQTAAFGGYRYVFGAQGLIGLRSILYDTLYLQAVAQLSDWAQFYSGVGASKYQNVAFNDLYPGLNISIGGCY